MRQGPYVPFTPEDNQMLRHPTRLVVELGWHPTRRAWVWNGPGGDPVPDNGSHDGDPEPQQTLFSWAEFMAEGPVRPKGRSRKPQPASLSMFEWALGMEREREAELVVVSR